MILVNLSRTWRDVEKGKRTAAEITLGRWAQFKDADLNAHGDLIVGIYKNHVVSVFDTTGEKQPWTRDSDNRVTFKGEESQQWKHLIGTANPGRFWRPGQGRPWQVLPTAILTEGSVPVEDSPAGRRAVVDGYVLTVPEEGAATLQVPYGRQVTVGLLPT